MPHEHSSRRSGALVSSFNEKSLIGSDPLDVVSQIHGFIDERVLNNDGATPLDLTEIKAALDGWTKDKFGFTPMGIMTGKETH